MAKLQFKRIGTTQAWAASGSISMEMSPIPFTMTQLAVIVHADITTTTATWYSDAFDRFITKLSLSGQVLNQNKTFVDFSNMRAANHHSRFHLGRFAPARPTVIADSQTNALQQFMYLFHFGVRPEVNGKLRAVHLVNGDRLLKHGEGIQAKAPAYHAKVVKADLYNHRFTLDTKLPADGSLEGRQMRILAGGKHRVSYRIAKVLPPGNVVEVDLPTGIFQSKIESMDGRAGTISTEIAPPIEAKPYGLPPGFYNGAVLTDETRTARYRVLEVDDKAIRVAPLAKTSVDLKPADFTAKDAFDRQMVRIFDFGEGDEIAIDGSAFARRGDDGKWEVSTTSDLKLLLRKEGRKDATPYAFPLTKLTGGKARKRLGE